MEKLDSAIVTLVQKMKVIVTLMMNAMMAFSVDQTIVQITLALILSLIAVMQIQKRAKTLTNQSLIP